MDPRVESRGSASVAWVKGSKHRFYEDRYRMLPNAIPIVEKMGRGELFAVYDGIGSAPRGRDAAQAMADILLGFYQKPDSYQASWNGVKKLLLEGNRIIHEWGFMPGTDRSLGGCAGTVVWLFEQHLYVFHAGDTAAVLIRDGMPMQLTQEHQLDSGAIFRYFGLGPHLELQVEKYSLEECDRILLLSDGITKVIHPMEAGNLVEEFGTSRQAVTALVRRALSLGSIDDITALLVEVEDL